MNSDLQSADRNLSIFIVDYTDYNTKPIIKNKYIQPGRPNQKYSNKPTHGANVTPTDNLSIP